MEGQRCAGGRYTDVVALDMSTVENLYRSDRRRAHPPPTGPTQTPSAPHRPSRFYQNRREENTDIMVIKKKSPPMLLPLVLLREIFLHAVMVDRIGALCRGSGHAAASVGERGFNRRTV